MAFICVDENEPVLRRKSSIKVGFAGRSLAFDTEQEKFRQVLVELLVGHYGGRGLKSVEYSSLIVELELMMRCGAPSSLTSTPSYALAYLIAMAPY